MLDLELLIKCNKDSGNKSALLIADIANVGCEEAQRETERMDSTDDG